MGWEIFGLPKADVAKGVVEDKGCKITSDAPVSGYYLDPHGEIAALIDAAKLGTDYVVAAYYRYFGGGQISVQATQDNTAVTISPKAGPPTSFVLNAGQTYLYADHDDVTGYHVSADKPIAVQSGNADKLVEQIPPIDALSTSYLVPLTRRVAGLVDVGSTGNVVRVVTSADDTEVAINGVTVAILNKGDFYEGVLRQAAQINTTHPALVVEYLAGNNYSGATFSSPLGSDPSMAIIPGSDQWLDHYRFNPSSPADVGPLKELTAIQASIVIETAALPSLRLNGLSVEPRLFKPIPGTGYTYGAVNFPRPLTDLTILAPWPVLNASDVTANRPFQLLRVGIGAGTSYFTSAGNSFAHGTALPPPVPTPLRKPPTAGGDLSMAANMFFFQLQAISGPAGHGS